MKNESNPSSWGYSGNRKSRFILRRDRRKKFLVFLGMFMLTYLLLITIISLVDILYGRTLPGSKKTFGLSTEYSMCGCLFLDIQEMIWDFSWLKRELLLPWSAYSGIR